MRDNHGCGLLFAAGATENAYRNNMVRGNDTALCGSATDAGGNIIP